MKLWISWCEWGDCYTPDIFTTPVEGALEVDSSVFEKESGTSCLFSYDVFEELVREHEVKEAARRQSERDKRLKLIEEEQLRKEREVQARARAYQKEKAALFAVYPKKQHKQLRLRLKEKYNLP